MSQHLEETLSVREEALLQRLLSDPTKYPMALKTWLISWLEGSDLTIPISSVVGLTSRLSALDRKAGQQSLIGGVATVTTGTNGEAVVPYASAVAATKSAVVTNIAQSPFGLPIPHDPGLLCSMHVSALATNGFKVCYWNVPTDSPAADQTLDLTWLALVTPL